MSVPKDAWQYFDQYWHSITAKRFTCHVYTVSLHAEATAAKHDNISADLHSSCHLTFGCCAQATTYVNNLLVGARNIDHRGQFHVLNLATNDTFQCSIKEPFFGKSRHEVGCHFACAQGAALRI